MIGDQVNGVAEACVGWNVGLSKPQIYASKSYVPSVQNTSARYSTSSKPYRLDYFATSSNDYDEKHQGKKCSRQNHKISTISYGFN